MRALAQETLLAFAGDSAPGKPTGKWRRRLLSFAALCGVWAIPGLVAGFVMAEFFQPPISLPRALTWQLLAWVSWAPWTALVIWLVRRVPFRRGDWWRAVLAHVCVSAAAASTQLAVVVLLDRIFFPVPISMTIGEHFRSSFIRYSDFEVVIYMAILAAGFALDYFRRFREGQFAAERLQTEMVKAQLLALRSQLNPHFLFNALNSVIALMDRDVPAAQKMVARLGELLRLSLGADEAEVPLAREMNLVLQYLEIEKIRFGDRLTVNVDVPEELLDVPVPNLVLQPLVENAIVHGVGPRTGPGRVTVQAHRLGDTLLLRVLDDGVGLSSNGARVGHGIGVGNTRARLAAIYGDRATLTLHQAEWGGCVAEVRLPLEPDAVLEATVGIDPYVQVTDPSIAV